jgi:hypothetical protein
MKYVYSTIVFILISLLAQASPNKFGMLKVEFQEQIAKSDLIVVGVVRPYSPESRQRGMAYFQVVSEEILKPGRNSGNEIIDQLGRKVGVDTTDIKAGSIIIEINNRVLSTLGSAPELQEGKKYMLFLKRVNIPSISKPNIAVEPVDSWKGVIALESASENRAVVGTLDAFGINIIEDPKSFIDAIRSAANRVKPQDAKVIEVSKKLKLD